MPAVDPALFAVDEFRQRLALGDNQREVFRAALEQARLTLDQRFLDDCPVEELIHGRAIVVDQLISHAWMHYGLENHSNSLSLVAVGGYGRAELHPYSDIDLLILMQHEPNAPLQQAIGDFLTFLWDIGLEVGHSVRTLAECLHEAAQDLTIITNLMESRTISGSQALHKTLMEGVGPQHMWPSERFFLSKREEQRQRHTKYNDTEYNLEPNVKGSPGGLRDIQTILWVARRRFGMSTLAGLQAPGFLTGDEYQLLARSRAFLWRVRYALHMLAGRSEDRLLLDYQHKLAELFGFHGDDAKQAIERFMQQYYRTAMSVAELGDFTNQILEENILRPDTSRPVLLNERFRIRDGYLEQTHDGIFQQHPPAIMEAFVLLAKHKHIKGVRSETIRQIREHRHLIDEDFRQNRQNTSLFIELFRCKDGVYTNLRRMNRYGILGRYLPEFGQIIGQMQHDLYHIYTVDAHTLNLIKHLRALRHADFAEKFSLAGAIMGRLPKPELIYLAGMYHDIGKGRGGDHSELGAIDADAFALRHQLPTHDRRLIVWLVRNHLVMSETAQRKDINDPEIIHNFAMQIGEQLRLDYLYVLTVADLNATNPKLWNSWRAQLLRQLYSETRRALRRGLENPLERDELIESRQTIALSLLTADGVSAEDVRRVWANLGDDYFLRHSTSDITWHCAALIRHGNNKDPLVLVRETSQRGFDGGTQIFVYAPNRSDLFAVTAAALDQLNLSIHEARIMTSKADAAIESYVVLGADGERIGNDSEAIQAIRHGLNHALRDPENYPAIIQRRIPRQLKHFSFSPQVSIHNDPLRAWTVVEVMAPDRPGLLARIGQVFLEFNLSLLSAKIITQGERIEDVFFLCDPQGKPLSDPELCLKLQEALTAQLASSISQNAITL